MKLLRDRTGRPGPATWEMGSFPEGQADFPVSGVSWHEAAAYAEFAGKSLPTLHHWFRAADLGIFSDLLRYSNFGGQGPGRVGERASLSGFGTYDMAGNVREWSWNLSGANRWILGGAWNDFEHMHVVPYSLPPLDRSATNGFRLARFSESERLAELSKPVEVFRRDFRTAKPVSDEIFEVFKRQFAYTPSPPDPKVVATDTSGPDWVRETVSLDTGYGERLTVHLFLPKSEATPRQAVIYFPGLGPFLTPGSSQNLTAITAQMDFIVKSGRVLVVPVWKGSYERFDGFVTLDGDRYLQTFRQRMHEWRQELGQTLDYLASRDDIHAERLAYWGVSFGASTTLPVLAMEPRFKAALLYLAGLPYRDLLPEVDAVNFVPRMTIPTLLLEARYDHLFPVETSQQPLLALLGAPADQKRQVLFDAGHGLLPRGQVIQESLAWLDKFLGPTY
jgi:eukaryotic-like serine/threonine-protein kinase